MGEKIYNYSANALHFEISSKCQTQTLTRPDYQEIKSAIKSSISIQMFILKYIDEQNSISYQTFGGN